MTSSKFILVKHEAIKRGTHYDLRFKMPNSKNWASFALNNLPPTEPGKRMSIVRTNDHSEREALFVGKIPEGEYGAGKLTKVDGGDCKIVKFTNAQMTVNFEGTVLQGIYHFINVGVFDRSRNYSKKVYIFFKAKNQTKKLNEYMRNVIMKKNINESPISSKLSSLKGDLATHFTNPVTYIKAVVASTIWLVFMLSMTLIGRASIKGLNKQIDKNLTAKIRKITGDNDIIIFRCLYDEVNAFCDGTPNLYYFIGIVKQLKLTEDELMAIMLHEFGHYAEKHVRSSQVKIVGSTSLLAAAVNLINIPDMLRILLTSYINLLVMLPLSRSLKWTEVEADTYPGKYGYGKAFISSLKKIKKYMYKEMCPGMSTRECDEYMESLHYWDEHPSPNERLKNLGSKIIRLAMSFITLGKKEKVSLLISKLKKVFIDLSMKGASSQFMDRDILSRL